MPAVSSSFPDYSAGKEMGTEVSSGDYSTLKVLCVPRSAQCSLSTWGQTEAGVQCNKDVWVAVLCLIKHLAKQTSSVSHQKSDQMQKIIWSKDSDMQTRTPT